MNHKPFTLLALGLMVIGLGTSLTACSDNDTLSDANSAKTTKTPKKKSTAIKAGRYDLIYLDQNTDGNAMYQTDSDGYTPTTALGIVVNNKARELTIGADNVNEHVGLKYASKPYVVITHGDDGDSVNVYRGPYTQYVQPAADGTVKSK